ncbi:MAG: phosphate ABC transporter substrate-binding protein PstS family protein [Actinobacteria bacterium]|nr:phosphate ABC transporter substrate-binding protein PstS family protein [Actinomycetota bacterium]
MTRLRDKALWKVLLVTMAFALMTAACGGDNGGSSGGSGSGSTDQPLSGEITASGSSTVEPITSTIAQLFSQENPDVAISVDGPGTGDGFALFCEGKTDISDASRPIEAEEQKLCKKGGIDYIELKVAIDGISVLTSKDNTEIDCLDFKDLYALLGPESEGFENWSDADVLGEEIGAGHVPYPDVPLEITAPGEESGTYDSFGELVLESIAYEDQGIKEDAPVIRPDYQSSANDNVIIQGVAGNETSLGWVGYAFYTENADKVRAIPVAEEGDDCIEPTEETIAAGEYPIARDLYFYVNAANAEENEALTAFVDYYLTEENLSTAVQETGYVEVPADVVQETITVWEDKETGTRDG